MSVILNIKCAFALSVSTANLFEYQNIQEGQEKEMAPMEAPLSRSKREEKVSPGEPQGREHQRQGYEARVSKLKKTVSRVNSRFTDYDKPVNIPRATFLIQQHPFSLSAQAIILRQSRPGYGEGLFYKQIYGAGITLESIKPIPVINTLFSMSTEIHYSTDHPQQPKAVRLTDSELSFGFHMGISYPFYFTPKVITGGGLGWRTPELEIAHPVQSGDIKLDRQKYTFFYAGIELIGDFYWVQLAPLARVYTYSHVPEFRATFGVYIQRRF